MEEVDLSTVLSALGDPLRLEIVAKLMKGSDSCTGSCPGELAKSTLSNHFRILREAGIVHSKKEGVSLVNCLRREELNKKFPGLLDSVLKSHTRGK
jgi:DNA-binding transcriptional ArsR family regulator